MKIIPLSKGMVSIVDDSDFEWLNQWKWHYGNKGYAMRSVHISGKSKDGKYKHKNILMHTLILKTPKGYVCDHINRNRLDNRRCNLRIATRLQNQHNMNRFCTNTSGYPGVGWMKKHRKWRVRITVNYKEIHLGRFSDLELAITARKNAEKIYFQI
jgi:hypothetical protein